MSRHLEFGGLRGLLLKSINARHLLSETFEIALLFGIESMVAPKAILKMATDSEISNTRDFLTEAKTGDALSAALLEFAAQFRPPQPDSGLKALATNISFTSTHLKQLHGTLQLPVQMKVDDELWTKVHKIVGANFEEVDNSLNKAIQAHKESKENRLEGSKLQLMKKL
jgi:hypothetical protein